MDDRYVGCRECGAKDTIEIDLTFKGAVGDGVVTWGHRPIDCGTVRCTNCETMEYHVMDLAYIGYEGITQEEIDEQR